MGTTYNAELENVFSILAEHFSKHVVYLYHPNGLGGMLDKKNWLRLLNQIASGKTDAISFIDKEGNPV